MPLLAKLRLTVRVFPREQPGFAGLSLGGTHNKQNLPQPATPRQFLLIIKNPEKISLGALANQIKDQWRELWPSEEPLQIKKLLDGAHPDAPFSVTCTVADVWFDDGRHAREGFDQEGTVHVIQPPFTSTPTPAHRYLREGSVFQDVEGAAAREANRMLPDPTIAGNDSLIGASRMTIRAPSREKEPDPQERQSKRPRLTDHTDVPAPSPTGSQRETTSGPLFYNDRPAPSYALPRSHRGHPPSTSKSSPEKGLGLGITASPAKDKTAPTRSAPGDIAGASSMAPPPRPPFSLRKGSDSSTQESNSQDDSPLGIRRSKRLINSVTRESSRAKGPQTRAASGSGRRSRPSRALGGPSKHRVLPQERIEMERKELEEARRLRRAPNTNPKYFYLLEKMEELYEERVQLRNSDVQDQIRLLDNNRRALSHRRALLQELKENGELYKESDANTTGEEELPSKRSKRHKDNQHDQSSEADATRRLSSLRAHTQSRRDRPSAVHGVQVAIDDLQSSRISPNKRRDANDSRMDGTRPEEDEMEDRSALEEHQDEDEDTTMDSDGGDFDFDATGPALKETKSDEPHETMPEMPAIDQRPTKGPSSGPRTLRMLFLERKEALAKRSPLNGKTAE